MFFTYEDSLGCLAHKQYGEFDWRTVRLKDEVQTESPFDVEAFDTFDTMEEPEGSRPFQPITLWLGVLGLAILFIPLYLAANTLSGELVRLETEMMPLQTALASTPGPPPQAQALIVTLTAVHNQANQMEAILPTLAAENVAWQQVMAAINDLDNDGMELTGIEQAGNQLLIRGRASNEGFVTNYVRQLETSGQFAQVVVQSIAVLPEPFLSPTPAPVLPTLTSTATTAPTQAAVPTTVPVTPQPTKTATPKLTDEFEPDDTTPKPIFVGAPPQLHNFYPDFDIDMVTFLAKAGRTYEVRTDLLSPGVDTFLTVTVGGTTLTNDDATIGVLSSSVILQAPPDSDIAVLVQVSNRGVFGPDKWYQLQVLELVPMTPTPSATSLPTHTPAPTVDLRDIHEPNDINPSPIAVGEAQIHNFYPFGDIDKVGFLVKNGRFYQLLTSQLGVGVDTAVTIDFNGESWSNDDYDLPGSGNFASSVCFPAEADGTAIATISNVAQQFDPSKTYVVSVKEVPFLIIDLEEASFGPVPAGDSNPPAQMIQIEGTEPLDWQVTTETPWLSTDVITGTTPSTLSLTPNIAGLAPGLHEGEITLGWVDSCRLTIPVMLQIDPVQSELPAGNGRILFAAKPIMLLQAETVEFVILVTLKPVEP